nr:NUMOD4 domain-containing protein [Riemerella anatipestifer]
MNNNEFGKEVWKPIEFDFEFTNDCRFEVSNLGRVRSFNKVSQGRILNGCSTTGGYKIIRLKLYRPRTEKEQQKFDELKAEISNLYNKRREHIKKYNDIASFEATTLLLEKKKNS